MKKKIISLAIISLAMLTTSETALASKYTVTGKVAYLESSSTDSYWNDLIALEGVTNVGPCTTDGNGLVKIRFAKDVNGTFLPENRLHTLVMTAISLDKPLEVRIDDSVLLNGDCTAMYVKIGV